MSDERRASDDQPEKIRLCTNCASLFTKPLSETHEVSVSSCAECGGAGFATSSGGTRVYEIGRCSADDQIELDSPPFRPAALDELEARGFERVNRAHAPPSRCDEDCVLDYPHGGKCRVVPASASASPEAAVEGWIAEMVDTWTEDAQGEALLRSDLATLLRIARGSASDPAADPVWDRLNDIAKKVEGIGERIIEQRASKASPDHCPGLATGSACPKCGGPTYLACVKRCKETIAKEMAKRCASDPCAHHRRMRADGIAVDCDACDAGSSPPDHEHLVDVNRQDTDRLRSWLARPNGGLRLGRVLFEAVVNGGILVRTSPFTSEEQEKKPR